MVHDERETSGMEHLLADVLVTASPETRVLLEYLRDPARMDPEERTRVEAYLESSPAHRDRLRVLKNLSLLDDFRALTGRSTSPAGQVAYASLTLSDLSARVEERISPLAEQRSRVGRTRVLLATAALALGAGIAIGVWLG